MSLGTLALIGTCGLVGPLTPSMGEGAVQPSSVRSSRESSLAAPDGAHSDAHDLAGAVA